MCSWYLPALCYHQLWWVCHLDCHLSYWGKSFLDHGGKSSPPHLFFWSCCYSLSLARSSSFCFSKPWLRTPIPFLNVIYIYYSLCLSFPSVSYLNFWESQITMQSFRNQQKSFMLKWVLISVNSLSHVACVLWKVAYPPNSCILYLYSSVE